MVGSAFFAAISGLKSQQIKLDVIANNIANLNTFGFKASRTAFSDLLSQTLRAASAPQAGRGGTNPTQVGLGVQLAAIDTLMSQGSIQTTGNLTDLALNGEGFFVISDGSTVAYTRAGNFTLDAQGALIASNGMRVQGWMTFLPDGKTIDTSKPITDIIVSAGDKIPGRATTTVNYVCNLNSASYTYGSAELRSAGSTGFTMAAGIALPIATYTGTPVDDGAIIGPGGGLDAGAGDLIINGQSITYSFPPGFVFGNPVTVAQFIAEQINSQCTTVYARAGTSGNLIIQNLLGGEGSNVVINGNPAYLSLIGLAAGTYTAPAPSSSLAGTHTITVTAPVAATGTSTVPVAAGALPADSITIMGTCLLYTSDAADE